ncbi:MAG: DUF924 domain-containing protein [Rhodospirillales bacterium]|nr:DUF924 domain-containing protein [Rhodospirillales bacterium]
MRDTKSEVLHFWFKEIQPQQWYQVSDAFDREVRERFAVVYNMSKEGLCDGWKGDPDGCLALCLVLDQFPRLIYRDTPTAYDTDGKALLVAKYAVAKGFDHALPPMKRRFIYMPYRHSERLSDQIECVALFDSMKKDDPQGYEHAVRHRDVIERFDRFPHRNKIMGRENTPEEEAFMAENPQGF